MTVRRHQIRAISTSIERLTRPIFQRRGFGGAGIVEHWEDIVGSHLASACTPERISYPGQSRRGGTLHLRIGSSSLALEIQHLEPQIIERINSHFGYGAIARLRIQHGRGRSSGARCAPRRHRGGRAERRVARPWARRDGAQRRQEESLEWFRINMNHLTGMIFPRGRCGACPMQRHRTAPTRKTDLLPSN